MRPLEALLGQIETVETDDARVFWETIRPLARALSPFELAVRGGLRADRVGLAFAAGYHAAVCALVPDRPGDRLAALCASEKGPPDPRHVSTTIDLATCEIAGVKGFVTFGTEAEDLYVLASAGEVGGRASLALAEVRAASPGVRVEALPPLGFVPEIPHARVRFEGARAERVLPGDGWADHVRPFRTIEDIHVHAALLAFLIGRARVHRWPADLVEEAMALVGSLATIAVSDPSSPATHLSLAGTIALSRALVVRLEPSWQSAPEAERLRWRRDQALLAVADHARAKRLEKARSALRTS